MIATCPTSDRLHAFALGQLHEQESDELYGHLASCNRCQQHLEESGSFSDTFVGQLKSDVETRECSDEPQLQIVARQSKDLAALLSRPEFETESQRMDESIPNAIGEYDIDRVIGRGGMGTVYLARHTKLGRQVALKVLSRHRLADPRMQGRFESEMKAVGRMNHPNIVAAHDAREIDGVAVLVTEFIDGLNVGSIIRRTGPLSVANAAQIAHQVASALAAIEEAGLIHRDIKPSNIMISRSGAVKLLDLGLARLQSADNQTHEHTATGQALGTVDYIAPEQVNDGRNVDIRADIYALGCTLFKMLTGHPVFDDSVFLTPFAKMTAHVQSLPPSITQLVDGVPEPIVALVDQMLEKDPARRPQTPVDVVNRLATFCSDADLAALVESALANEEKPRAARVQSISTATPKTQPLRTRRIPVYVAIATGLFGLLGGWLFGIIITIKHPDGSTTRLEVPDGSSVSIDADGNPTVEVPGSNNSESSSIPQRSSSSAEAKFNGIWRVIIPPFAGTKKPLQHYYVFVNGKYVRFDWIEGDDREYFKDTEGYFRVDKNSDPKQIDFFGEGLGNAPSKQRDHFLFNSSDSFTITCAEEASSPRPVNFAEGTYRWKFQRVNLSGIKGESSLPPDVSVHAYQVYKRWMDEEAGNPDRRIGQSSTNSLPTNSANNSPATVSSHPLAFDGTWRVEYPPEYAGSYAVFIKGRFAFLTNDTDNEGQLVVRTSCGTWQINDRSGHNQIEFPTYDPDGVFSSKFDIEIIKNEILALTLPGEPMSPRDIGSPKYLQPGSFQFRYVQWPTAVEPNDIPDQLERWTLQASIQLRADNFPFNAQPVANPNWKPANFSGASPIEGIWKVESPVEIAGSYVVMANEHFAAISPRIRTDSVDGIKGWCGKYKIQSTSTCSRIDFTADEPGGAFLNRSIWHIGADGVLQIAQAESEGGGESDTGAQAYPWSFHTEDTNAEQFRLQRVDWSHITDPNELTDPYSRSAFQTFQHYQNGIFPLDVDFTPIPLPSSESPESSIK